MKYIFNFPDIGEGLDEGTIVEWLVKKGQRVEVNDVLVTMETDKVVAEIPSPKTGIISNLFGKIGDVVKVGEAIVEFDLDKDNESSLSEEKKTEIVEEKAAGVVGTLEVAGNNAILTASDEGFERPEKSDIKKSKILATPVARAMAKDMNVDINKVKGTGPAGRVMKKDIQEYFDNQFKLSSKKEEILVEKEEIVEIEKMSQIRKTIALNMTKSKHNAAHMSLFDDVEISELVRVRNKYKNIKEGLRITYLPFIIKAVAFSLKRHKSLNSQMDLEAGEIFYKKYYNIGVAMDTERGLVVPVIKNTDKLSIVEIAEQLQIFIEKAENNKLTMEDLRDGTFSVTSYGSIGGKYAMPVINYPQAAIIGIGKISQQPIAKDGQLAIGAILPLSISVDHRIVDGAEVSRFINTLSGYLNDPVSLIFE